MKKQREIPVGYVFATGGLEPPDRPALVPPVDVVDHGRHWRLTFEIPGANPEEISVDIHGRILTLRGRRRPTDREEGVFLRVERAAGAFERALELPEDPDPEGSRASYADGLLTLDVPKRSGGKGRSIPIVKGKKG
jgi:HSP20 family protein